LLGLGGGLIVVPCLLFIFPLIGIDPAISMHLAVGTSLATVIATVSSSLLTHLRRDQEGVIKQLVRRLGPSIIIGSISGAILANYLSAKHLALIFGIVVWLLALRVMFVRDKPISAQQHEQDTWNFPGAAVLNGVMVIMGMLSAIMGIGGGGLLIPFLQHCKVTMRYAIGVASACSLPLGIIGASVYMVTGWQKTQALAWSTGYVYWPAAIGIVITSMIFAPIGVKLAHRLPARVLRKIFVVFMLFIGFRMIFL
jgi:uncharacterized membrane protein YfcA